MVVATMQEAQMLARKQVKQILAAAVAARLLSGLFPLVVGALVGMLTQ